MTPAERAELVKRLNRTLLYDRSGDETALGEDAAAEITRLSAELAEANAALAWCVAMPPEDVSYAKPAVWTAWLSKQPDSYAQAVTRATTPPLAEPPH